MSQAAIVGALLILRGAEGILNGSSDTNTTLGDEDWTASLGLAISLSIPVCICLIPCAFITWVRVVGFHDGSSYSMASSNFDCMPTMLAMCYCSGILGLVALVVGLVSVDCARRDAR